MQNTRWESGSPEIYYRGPALVAACWPLVLDGRQRAILRRATRTLPLADQPPISFSVSARKPAAWCADKVHLRVASTPEKMVGWPQTRVGWRDNPTGAYSQLILLFDRPTAGCSLALEVTSLASSPISAGPIDQDRHSFQYPPDWPIEQAVWVTLNTCRPFIASRHVLANPRNGRFQLPSRNMLTHHPPTSGCLA